MENTAKIIAVAGKGGVGKTSISAMIVRILTQKYPDKKILAIDADPAVGLSVALGVDVKLTLDDIRMSVVDSVENGETREALELLSEARFKIFDALVEMPGFAFLAIGRPESSGCYCKVNAYLKEVIGVLANSFDYVVIDGEAGIEQIQRRVMEKVTHLLLITDQSKKGTQVITTIKGVADDLIVYERIGAIINRMTNPELADMIKIPGVEILAKIPADSDFAANDIKGNSVMQLPETNSMLNGVKEALQKIEIL
jgi:CO dehydrogenase maturation factor